MTPPTIKELCEEATPGPWQARFIYRLFSSARRDIRMKLGAPQEQDWPNAELIARCSPSVMLAVMEKLEAIAQHGNGPQQLGYWSGVVCANVAKSALNLLNGKAP